MQTWKFIVSLNEYSRIQCQQIVNLDYLGHDEESWSELTEDEQRQELDEAYSSWVADKTCGGYEEVSADE
jgi:hypothetical protein